MKMYQWSLFVVFAFLLCFSVRGQRLQRANEELRAGDIVFQYIPCGDLCQAIVETTPCDPAHPFNHCGIVVKDGKGIVVIEAIGKNVHATPLPDFLKRDTSHSLYVGRPDASLQQTTAATIKRAKAMIGRPYDDAFLPGDTALYCSELVYECYRTSGGIRAFELQPMTFKSPSSGKTYPAWDAYYKDLKLTIPEGVPGINPCAIANSDKVGMMLLIK